jgi:sarcosine oxidase subunit beta
VRPGRQADVVIVGGGIVGVASAYYLARAGRRVVLVERGAIASEASGRNGGHISPTIDGPWAPLAQLALATWPELSAELGQQIEFVRGGGLYVVVADDPTEPADLLAYRHRRGFVAEAVSPEDCRRLLPGLAADVKGGVLSPRHGQANPLLTSKRLAGAAQAAGATLRLHTAATAVLVRNDQVEGVLAGEERIEAPIVVDAAGAWAPSVAAMAGVACPVTPRRIQILLSEARPPLTDLIWAGNGLYARQARAGQLHFGSAGPAWELAVDAYDRNVSPGGMQSTARRMVELMPGLADLRILRSWSGIIGPSADGAPRLGVCASPRGFIIATGFGGNGFVTGPAVGKVVAELAIQGRASIDIAGLDPSRFALAATS